MSRPVRIPARMAECHPDRPYRAKGLCGACDGKAYRQRHPDVARASTRKWHANNREYHNALNKKWEEEHCEQYLAAIKHWDEEHPERRKAIAAKWRANNPEKHRAAVSHWREEHPDKELDYNARRRALTSGAETEEISREVIYARDGGRCGICKKPVEHSNFDLDHILPLSKGGKHVSANVQIAHGSCNSHKFNTGISQLRML